MNISILKQAHRLVLFLSRYFPSPFQGEGSRVRLYRDLLRDALFPVECLACGRPGQWLCSECRPQLIKSGPQVCPVCKSASIAGSTHQTCHSLLDGVMVMGEYQGLLKRAIRAGKYQFAYEVVDELAETLADFVDNQSELAQIDWLVVMPLSRRRLLWRGFNQSQLLAQRLMTVYQCPELSHDLLKIADTVPQAQLAWRERFNLSADNFTWRGQSLADQTVLVVDDVMTTGRTLEAVAEVLKRAGAERVYGVVLARN